MSNDYDAHAAELREIQARHRPAGVPDAPVYPLGEISLPDHVSTWAQRRADRPAIVFDTLTLTYADLDEKVKRVAGWLQAAGVTRGDRVAVHLPNCPQFVITMLAVLRAGGVHVPVNPMFTADEIAYELGDSGATVLLTATELWSQADSALERGEEVAVEQVLMTSIMEMVGGAAEMPDGGGRSITPFATALEHEPTDGVTPDLDALAALNYTGGTTGMPKGCEHSQRHMLYTAASTATATEESADTDFVALCYLPIFWIAGEDLGILLPVVLGGTSVLMVRWDADTALTQIERHKVTTMVGTVENYLEMASREDISTRDLSSLERPMAVSFVRKMDPEVRRRWVEAVGEHSVLREASYGMTETHTMDTTPHGFQADDADLHEEPVFTGLPVPGTDILVVDWQDGHVLALGEAGEIVVRSPSVTTGYWRKPEATAEQLRDGWLHTGDNGRIDERGRLHFLGRAKEMIKVKGMSVFPAELEMVIARHPSVGSCAVVPATDPANGQRPVAFVTAAPGATVEVADLEAHVRASLASYKVPELIVLEEFPMTATGKIRKVELGEQAQRAVDESRSAG